MKLSLFIFLTIKCDHSTNIAEANQFLQIVELQGDDSAWKKLISLVKFIHI